MAAGHRTDAANAVRLSGKAQPCRHCGDMKAGGKVLKAHESWCDPSNTTPGAIRLRTQRDKNYLEAYGRPFQGKA